MVSHDVQPCPPRLVGRLTTFFLGGNSGNGPDPHAAVIAQGIISKLAVVSPQLITLVAADERALGILLHPLRPTEVEVDTAV